MNSELFEPVSLGKIQLKNRVILSPVSLFQSNSGGTLTQEAKNFYLRRAEGGVGLIILGGHTVDSRYAYAQIANSIDADADISSYRSFINAVHSHGCKVFVQLIHPGPDAVLADKEAVTPAPSAYVTGKGQQTREMSVDEIETAIQKYGEAAKRSEEAGFDGIEIHAAHAYMLPGSFLSPLRNHRSDAYGGEIENRARFLINVIKCIRGQVSENYPVMLRISGSEKLNGGNMLEDTLKIIPSLVSAGVSAFDVSGGTQYEEAWRTVPRKDAPFGVNLAEAEAIKLVCPVPVFVVGKINDIQAAAQCVKDKKADGVIICRGLFADAELVNKGASGQFDKIRSCAACGACFKRIQEFKYCGPDINDSDCLKPCVLEEE